MAPANNKQTNKCLMKKFCFPYSVRQELRDNLVESIELDDKTEEKLILVFANKTLSAHWPVGLTCLTCAVFLLVA